MRTIAEIKTEQTIQCATEIMVAAIASIGAPTLDSTRMEKLAEASLGCALKIVCGAHAHFADTK